MEEPNSIMLKPVKEIINKISSSKSDSIILAGMPGSGKSTVINEYINNTNNDKIVVNGTVGIGEYIFIRDESVFNLYHTCLIISKILLNIQKKYPKEFLNDFVFFSVYIESILKQIIYMHMSDTYRSTTTFINDSLYVCPELLIDNLLDLMVNSLRVENITLVLDNFDRIGTSSIKYQTFIYERLKSYFNLIMAISDENSINNTEKINSLKVNNEIINVDYSADVDSVIEILDKESHKILRTKLTNYDFRYRLRFVLDKNTIAMMIEKTNGNLFDMLSALRVLYRNIPKLKKEEYGLFILNYIDKEINKSPYLSGIVLPKRTLHIK